MPKKRMPSNPVRARQYKQRMQEFFVLFIIVLLSFATALAVFFLDSTKDLRNRAADDVGTVCNRTCTENRDCLSNMICYPYNRASDQKGVCRLDSNPTNEQCKEKQGIGFVVQAYNDLNADGVRNNNEQGLDWEFRWDLNGNEGWNQYNTYADKNGEGGRVANLAAGDVIRVRIQGKSGWEVVTPTEVKLVMANETTRVAYFGMRKPVPTPTPVVAKPTSTPTTMTKGGLGYDEPVVVLPSPSPTPRITATPSATPSPSATPIVVVQEQPSYGFLGWLRNQFRKFYCWVSRSCVIE